MEKEPEINAKGVWAAACSKQNGAAEILFCAKVVPEANK